MFKSLIAQRVLLVLFTIVSMPLAASAQANRTWVSGVGDDVNPCSRTAPCKTFAGAIFRTSVGGEIDCLDPAGYGTVTISKSITIDGTGAFGTMLAGSTTGIIINITAAPDTAKTVRLHSLSINGLGTGTDGIRVMSASHVFIDEVLIDGFNRHGINVGAPGAFIQVTRSTIRNVARYGINLEIAAGATGTNLSVESSNLSTCEIGLVAGPGTNATARNSAFMHNAIGVAAERSDLLLESCIVAHGGRGVMAHSRSTIRISRVTITNNQVGLAIDAGKIISFKDNIIHGNVVDGVPSSTVLPI